MIRILKPSILEMDSGNDNDAKEEPITLIVDTSGLTVSIKEGSLYRTKMGTEEKGICQITYISLLMQNPRKWCLLE
jgi:hypothetical protein